MSKIADIKAREILDSRGNPTIETTVYLDTGIYDSASVPSGASTGTYEAYELRDNDSKRYSGKGVLKAVLNVETVIKKALLGNNPLDQEVIDNKMLNLDGTANKSRLGANSILSVSLAVARVAAYDLKLPLYSYLSRLAGEKSASYKPVIPFFNVINGGLHGSGKFNLQEFFLIPLGFSAYDEMLMTVASLFQQMKRDLKRKGFYFSVGDEGGFTPNFATNEEVLGFLNEEIISNNLKGKVRIALDLASSTYYKEGKYQLVKDGDWLNKEQYLSYLENIRNKYNLYSLEDPYFEDDWDNWRELTTLMGGNTLIVGDDLLVTNITRLNQAIDKKACNTILIKPNQIGSLTETLSVIKTAKKNNFKIVISHRSGETNDSFIADLAVGVNAEYAKFGAPSRGERVAKYNRLLEIYKEIQK